MRHLISYKLVWVVFHSLSHHVEQQLHDGKSVGGQASEHTIAPSKPRWKSTCALETNPPEEVQRVASRRVGVRGLCPVGFLYESTMVDIQAE